jgi:hypothetical protein
MTRDFKQQKSLLVSFEYLFCILYYKSWRDLLTEVRNEVNYSYPCKRKELTLLDEWIMIVEYRSTWEKLLLKTMEYWLIGVRI